MIEEIIFKNVLSFRDEVTLSFEATDDKNLDATHVVTMPNGVRLLRLGIVYGSNASGKSNLLYAIEGLYDFWLFDPKNMDVPTGIEPFLLDTQTPCQPSEYSIKFWVNGVRYWYQLVVTDKRVISEKLSYYKTVQPIMVFDRQLVDGQSVLRFNANVQKVDQETHKALTLYCLPNMSFFAARGHVNFKMEYVDTVREWMRTAFMPMIEPQENMTRYGQRKIRESVDFKQHLLNFLHMADFNITGLNDHIEEEGIIQKPVIGFEHTVENERGVEKYELNIKQQSAGTKRIMGVEAAIYEACRKNAFLMIDEMETSLHSELMEYIIQQFLLERNESQLLVTTHYIGLMEEIDKLIRRDNIWFVEKGKTGSTDLYSLVEFKGLNKVSHFEKAYRNGMFGALPLMKD